MRILTYLAVLAVFGFFTPFQVKAQEAENAQPQSADEYLKDQGSVPAMEKPKAEEPAAAPAKIDDKKEDAAAAKPVESPDMIAKKVELARKIHQIRPTRIQVDSAIEQAAAAMPEEQRVPFVTAMKSVLNYNAIEKISVDAMVETFTLPELVAMEAYQSSPEAQSISEKMPKWAMKVQPEVARMIDAAMMRVKTGGTK